MPQDQVNGGAWLEARWGGDREGSRQTLFVILFCPVPDIELAVSENIVV